MKNRKHLKPSQIPRYVNVPSILFSSEIHYQKFSVIPFDLDSITAELKSFLKLFCGQKPSLFKSLHMFPFCHLQGKVVGLSVGVDAGQSKLTSWRQTARLPSSAHSPQSCWDSYKALHDLNTLEPNVVKYNSCALNVVANFFFKNMIY